MMELLQDRDTAQHMHSTSFYCTQNGSVAISEGNCGEKGKTKKIQDLEELMNPMFAVNTSLKIQK